LSENIFPTLCILCKQFSLSLFFYLFSFAMNLWHRKFVAALRRHCRICQQSTWCSVMRTRFW